LSDSSRVSGIGGEWPVPEKSKVSFLLSAGFHLVPVNVGYVSLAGIHNCADASHNQLDRLAASPLADALRETSDMPTKTFTSGRIKKADYNTASRQLDLHWDNKTVLAYKHVPEEVYRRLCSAPNPAAYWEDRIAEEYPKGTPMTSSADPDGAKKLSDLFGGGD